MLTEEEKKRRENKFGPTAEGRKSGLSDEIIIITPDTPEIQSQKVCIDKRLLYVALILGPVACGALICYFSR